jgi:DNA-binding MarR family transcriptional regulator
MTPRIIYLIRRAEAEVSSRMDKALEPYGLRPIQYTLLYFINLTEGNPSSAQLSRRFSITPQSMGEQVQILLQKKLVKKETDPAHRRILRLSVTEKGSKLLDACNTALDEMEEILLKDFNSADKDMFRSLMGRILSSGVKEEVAPKEDLRNQS